ncbi:MAG: META domain-containing protein [Pseudomonadota bacterium]|nr:META domain-containing protein [Pseudomonadota bacterium]
MIGRTVSCALGALGLTACAATVAPGPAVNTAAPASLVGTRWVGVAEGADPRTLPRLEFVREGRVTGYTGCNMMSGTYQVEAGEIRMGPIVATKRMCMGPEGEVERRFLAATGGRVLREGGKLVFSGPGAARFEFTPAQAS